MQPLQDPREPSARCHPPAAGYADLKAGSGAEMPIVPEGPLSAFARAIDWLASSYGILFLVSAGNSDRLLIPNLDLATFAGSNGEARSRATLSGLNFTMHDRRLLPPSEASNCLTIGALHDDEIGAPPE